MHGGEVYKTHQTLKVKLKRMKCLNAWIRKQTNATDPLSDYDINQ